MPERPILDKSLKSETFQEYYYLKEELVQFCRDNGLPVSGGKIELTERIAHYLDTGESKTVKVEKGKKEYVAILKQGKKPIKLKITYGAEDLQHIKKNQLIQISYNPKYQIAILVTR